MLIKSPLLTRRMIRLWPNGRKTATLSILIISTLLIFSQVIFSQVCTGSFGDPVLKIDFGNSGIAGLSPYVPASSYSYTSSSCPDDGYYTITNRTSGCFNDHWHTVTSDHTGMGNFMLVNAAYTAGDFFLATVNGLCPNTTYEFSAWILNVMKTYGSVNPNLQFNIESTDGTVLGTYTTGELYYSSAPRWDQYGFLFSTPASNPAVVLRITNKSPGGNGNDLALDDISFRPCGAEITAHIVNNNDTLDFCSVDDRALDFSGSASSVYVAPVYQWQLSTDMGSTWNDIPGAISDVLHRSANFLPGNYWYRLTVVDASVAGITSCRIASKSLVVNSHSLPNVDVGPDRTYVTGFPVTLNAIATGEDISFSWRPAQFMNDTASLHPVISPPVDLTYLLQVRTAFGCTASDQLNVKVVPDIFVPSAFTPNNDGLNDCWRIPFLDPSLNADVRLFNRDGQVVYHSKSTFVSWDGKVKGIPQPPGVYVYVITFTHPAHPLIKGLVTLIR